MCVPRYCVWPVTLCTWVQHMLCMTLFPAIQFYVHVRWMFVCAQVLCVASDCVCMSRTYAVHDSVISHTILFLSVMHISCVCPAPVCCQWPCVHKYSICKAWFHCQPYVSYVYLQCLSAMKISAPLTASGSEATTAMPASIYSLLFCSVLFLSAWQRSKHLSLSHHVIACHQAYKLTPCQGILVK